MKQETIDAIGAHAVDEYPRECCGVVIVEKGREKYIRCANVATSKAEHFAISGRDYAAAEERGEIVAIAHSHIDAPPVPSEADRVSCEEHGVPWIIVSVRSDAGRVAAAESVVFEPQGYSAPLVGRDFAHGVLDCYAIVRDWYARERSIELPNFPRRDGWWDAGENLYMDNLEAAGFERATGALQVGDVILMHVRNPADANKQSPDAIPGVANHAAVYIGDGVMLHHLYGRLSSRDVYGGYWQEVTRCVVRRKA
jgi:proteasome lid subunit RPN8/RPN11